VDTEETLVAELMMTSGMDATLIGALEKVSTDSTDFLCLSSFQHNFALISWLAEATVAAQWQRLGLAGTVAPPGATNGHYRKPRIYYLPLTQATTVADILAELERLQRERSVKTVGIQLGTAASPSKTAFSGTAAPHANPTKFPEVSSQAAAALAPIAPAFGLAASAGGLPIIQPPPTRHPAASLAPSASQASRNPSSEEEEEEEWEELDRLVDELDAFEF
jgi:hypothetical protein